MYEFLIDRVDQDVWQRRQDEFARTCLSSIAAGEGMFFQRSRSIVESLYGRRGETGMMLIEVLANPFEVVRCGQRPAQASQRWSIRATRVSISSSVSDSPRAI